MTYRLPAEWEPQESILLAWPHNTRDWPGKFAPIPWVYADIVGHITRAQRVRLIVQTPEHEKAVAEILTRAHVPLDRVVFHTVRTNRVWTRDCGPITVWDGSTPLALTFSFNAWAKYTNYRHDARVATAISAAMKRRALTPLHHKKPVVLEGGAIDSNGAGTLLTTRECLLSETVQCRNPGFGAADYEALFHRYLGITNVIWLEAGIVGDDTHGHVDDIARFVAPRRVVACVEPQRRDDNHTLLKRNFAQLQRATDAAGKPLEVVPLPMPRPLYFETTRLPASYANFLICNRVVLVPTFNDVNDRVALATLAQCFPDREVVGIHCTDMVWGFGTLHCASMQLPARS